jgi:hypothetical protein
MKRPFRFGCGAPRGATGAFHPGLHFEKGDSRLKALGRRVPVALHPRLWFDKGDSRPKESGMALIVVLLNKY